MEPPECPWCGFAAETWRDMLDKFAPHYVGCANPACRVDAHASARTPDLAITAWNTRNGVPPASVPQDDHDPRIDPRPGDNLEVVEKDDFENTSSAHHYRVLCVVEDHVGYKLYGAAWRGFMHLPAWQEKMKAATVMKVPEGNLQPKSSVPQETTEGVKRGD